MRSESGFHTLTVLMLSFVLLALGDLGRKVEARCDAPAAVSSSVGAVGDAHGRRGSSGGAW